MTQNNNDLKDVIPEAALGKLKRDLSESLEKKDDNSWLLEHNEIEFTKELGNGKAGTVFKGLYKGSKVAIKVLKSQSKAGTIEEFKKEFQIMR
jgi:predicted Ser/Thr protein kinase